MRAYLKILFTAVLLQGCVPVVEKAVEPAEPEPQAETGRLENERRRQAGEFRLRALELERRADYINAVRERIAYHSHLDHHADIQANNAKIWGNLNRVDRETLLRLYRSDPGALSGWLEAARINRTLLTSPEAMEQALADWQENYPAHPANPAIIEEIRATARLYNIRPQRIALLLPLHGALREASEAVRDGFITAWFRSGRDRTPLKIYEANSLNVEQAYSRAVADGADFIVGPLEKQALSKLSALPGLPVPTLALNQVRAASETASGADGNVLPALMQFSLSPEEEARQVAKRARADGYGRALVIIPDNQWGRRLHGAFRDSWTAAGGVILETAGYDPQANDYGTPVKKMLNIDASESRAGRLRRLLGRRLEDRERRRRDADVIFMAAVPIAGRQIIPQLRFHNAGQIPVYATSHIFTGSVNPQADTDMNGVIFPDLPWILSPEGKVFAVKTLVDVHFQAGSSTYRRLYAFGADAFNLISHLPRLAYDDEAQFNGATGALSMTAGGRINRKLPWGRFTDGKPELLGGI